MSTTNNTFVYYQLEGRVINGKIFCKQFHHINLLEARIAAFNFLLHYVTILTEQNEMYLPTHHAKEYKEIDLMKYSYNPFAFVNPDVFPQGITLTLHIHHNNTYHKWLIYKIGTYTTEQVKVWFQSLEQEYQYFIAHSFELAHYTREVDFSRYLFSEETNNKRIKSTILYIPFNWNKNHLLSILPSELTKKYPSMCNTPDTVAFVGEQNLLLIHNEIVSLFNTKGGHLYTGLSQLKQGKGYTPKQAITELTYFQNTLFPFLGSHCDTFTIKQATFKGMIFMMYEIKPKEEAPVIYELEPNKEIMSRDSNGFKILKSKKEFWHHFQNLNRMNLSDLYDLCDGEI